MIMKNHRNVVLSVIFLLFYGELARDAAVLFEIAIAVLWKFCCDYST